MTATNTLIQSRVPDELRSRVMAVYATMMMGMQPIGSLIAGGVANALERRERLPRLGFLYCWGALFSCFACEAAAPGAAAQEPQAGFGR